MRLVHPLLAAALVCSGVALAQTGGPPPANPTPSGTGSTHAPPASGGTDTRSGTNPGGAAMTPPVSSGLGTTPTPEAVLADLHMANQSEVDLGHLAAERAQNKDVKKFAKHMISAHTKMDKDAQSWAKKNKVTVGPPPQDASHQEEMAKMQATKQRLQTLTGSEFDKAYMRAMAEDHAQDLERVSGFEQQVADKSLRKLLTSARKEIASHKREADKLVQKLGTTAAR